VVYIISLTCCEYTLSKLQWADRWPSWNPIWPTPEVQTSDFTGFLDPENVGVGTEITIFIQFQSYRQKYVKYGGHIKIKDGGHQGAFWGVES